MGKDYRSELKLKIVASITAFIIGTWITAAISEKILDWDNILKSASIGAIWALLGFIISYLHELNKKMEETLNNRMNKIIEFVAMGTKNGKFENILAKLKGDSIGDLRWSLAKFISHKINKSFINDRDDTIYIEGVTSKEYSQLLAELVMECRNSIYYTCPYTPKQWFELLENKCNLCDNCVNNAGSIKRIHFADLEEHIKALCNSRVDRKIRLLNLKNDSDFAFFTNKNHLECIKNFVRYYKDGDEIFLTEKHNIIHKVVKPTDLKTIVGSGYGDLLSDDYNVLDEKIVMKWDDYDEDGKENVCS